MKNLPEDGMVVPTACLVEILYLLGNAGGRPLQRKLWTMVDSGVLQLRSETKGDCIKAAFLMETYADVPMDFADGIVVATADALNVNTVFTIDPHFYAYRRLSGDAFTVILG